MSDTTDTPSPATTEAALLNEVDALCEAGVLHSVNDRFVVTETIAPGIELGYSIAPALACRYPSHRHAAWTTDSGLLLCAICHPDRPNQPSAQAK